MRQLAHSCGDSAEPLVPGRLMHDLPRSLHECNRSGVRRKIDGNAGLSSCRSRHPLGSRRAKFCRNHLTFIGHAASVFRGHLHSLRHTFLVGYQARPDGSGLTTAWRPAPVHRSTSNFTRSSQARPLARSALRSSFCMPEHCFGLLLPALERLGSINRPVEHGKPPNYCTVANLSKIIDVNSSVLLRTIVFVGSVGSTG